MSSLDFVVVVSKDPWFTEQFPVALPEHQFADNQSLYRFLDEAEGRLVLILDGRPEGFAGWSKNHLVVVFHDYASGSLSGLYDAGDVAMAFNRDDDNAYALVNSLVEHMIV